MNAVELREICYVHVFIFIDSKDRFLSFFMNNFNTLD